MRRVHWSPSTGHSYVWRLRPWVLFAFAVIAVGAVGAGVIMIAAGIASLH